MAVYKKTAYSVNETGGGIQVIDLRRIDRGRVRLVREVQQRGLRTVHNISVNEASGYAYLSGSNLSRGGPVINRRGTLWRHIRSSSSLPGIFAPVVAGGDLIVDGGLVNNFPVDIMRQDWEAGAVIGASVSPREGRKADYDFDPPVRSEQARPALHRIPWARRQPRHPLWERLQPRFPPWLRL